MYEMLRSIGSFFLAASVFASACGGGDELTGTGGTGGTMMFEPGPTCIAFCAKAVGECEFLVTTEAACRQSCEQSLFDEGAKSEACGEAVEAVFQCATELDCQGIYDWRDKEPPDAYPCIDEVNFVGTVCPLD